MSLEFQNKDIEKNCRVLAKEKGFMIKKRSEFDIDFWYPTNTGRRKKGTVARWEYLLDILTQW